MEVPDSRIPRDEMKIPPHNPKPINRRLRCLRRGDWVHATPEEKVRQRVLNYLLKKSKYAKLHIKVEARINYDKKEKSESNKEHGRADIIILDEEHKPWMIVECKRSDVENGQKYQISNDDIEQAKGYANAEKVNMVWITTGDENEFWEKYRDTWRPCNKNPFGLSDTKIWRPVRFPESDSAKALSNYFKKDCPDERYKNYFDKSIDEAIFVSSIQKLIHELNFQKWIDADHKKLVKGSE